MQLHHDCLKLTSAQKEANSVETTGTFGAEVTPCNFQLRWRQLLTSMMYCSTLVNTSDTDRWAMLTAEEPYNGSAPYLHNHKNELPALNHSPGAIAPSFAQSLKMTHQHESTQAQSLSQPIDAASAYRCPCPLQDSTRRMVLCRPALPTQQTPFQRTNVCQACI